MYTLFDWKKVRLCFVWVSVFRGSFNCHIDKFVFFLCAISAPLLFLLPILLFFFVFYGKVERVILIRHCINTLLIGEENRCVLIPTKSKSSEMTTLLKLCMIFFFAQNFVRIQILSTGCFYKFWVRISIMHKICMKYQVVSKKICMAMFQFLLWIEAISISILQ